MKRDENPPQFRDHDLADELFTEARRRNLISRFPLADDEYCTLFWRPYLGLTPYTLWDVLRYNQEYSEKRERWPSISLIAYMMGDGADRYTILGRAATKDRPAQEGALDRLVREHLVAYDTVGEGRGRRYVFTPRKKLPLLTPSQLRRAGPGPLHKRHEFWLKQNQVDVPLWEQIRAPSFVPLL